MEYSCPKSPDSQCASPITAPQKTLNFDSFSDFLEKLETSFYCIFDIIYNMLRFFSSFQGVTIFFHQKTPNKDQKSKLSQYPSNQKMRIWTLMKNEVKKSFFYLMMWNCLKNLFVAFNLSKNAQLRVFWLIFIEKSHFGDPIDLLIIFLVYHWIYLVKTLRLSTHMTIFWIIF